MDRLVAVDTPDDIPSHLRETPIGRLLGYHNLGAELGAYERAELLVGMCMDHRKRLRLPENFSYVLRTAGANLRFNEFQVSYAIAVGGVEAIAVIGHSDCGMAGVNDQREAFVDGLVDRAGWDVEEAETHFDRFAPRFGIGDPVEFALSEAERLRERYPGILVAALHYRVEDNRLYWIRQ